MTSALWLAAALSGIASAGTGAQVQLSVSTSAAGLAKPVTIVAHAAFPAGSALALDLARSTTEIFAIVQVEASAPVIAATSQTQDIRVEVLPLAIGKLPIRLWWNLTAAAKTAALDSGPLILDVTGPVVGPTTKIEDIRPPAKARRLWWPWLLAALAAGALAYAYYRWKTRAAAGTEAAPADTRPSDVAALEALEALRASPLWREGRFKEFYAALTDVVRLYLERRFEIPATRLTTEELSRHLKQSEVDRAVVLKIKAIFDRADLVKFAKLAPEDHLGPADIDGAVAIVQETRPAQPSAAAEMTA